MACPKNSIDSNVAGLRYAEEVCLNQLPVLAVDGHDPVWKRLDPNSFSDFGGQNKMVARNPFNPGRQRRKGVITDLDASGGFQQDLTQTGLNDLMQGFVFASFRAKPNSAPYSGPVIPITAVAAADDSYAITLAGVKVGDILAASGFDQTANNGVVHVATVAGGKITTIEALADEAAPPAAAALRVVGHRFAVGDISIALNGGLARLTSAAVDFTTFGFIPGEWLYLGADVAAGFFPVSNGFARIGKIAAGYLELDKTDWVPQVEASGAKAIEIYFGDVLKNEEDPTLIVRRSYDLERTVGSDANGVMSEHVTGAVPNQLTLNVKQADKVTADLTFVGCGYEARSGADGLEAGARPGLLPEDAFNTSSDFARIKLALVTPTSSAPVPLFAFSTDLTLTINNNVAGSKALGVLGSFDTDVGDFEVGGSVTAYFSSMVGVNAVKNNADVTIDVAIVKHNAGLLFDIPLLSLGNGRLAVEKNKKVTLPLDMTAAENNLGYTMMYQVFGYLPNLANPT